MKVIIAPNLRAMKIKDVRGGVAVTVETDKLAHSERIFLTSRDANASGCIVTNLVTGEAAILSPETLVVPHEKAALLLHGEPG